METRPKSHRVLQTVSTPVRKWGALLVMPLCLCAAALAHADLTQPNCIITFSCPYAEYTPPDYLVQCSNAVGPQIVDFYNTTTGFQNGWPYGTMTRLGTALTWSGTAVDGIDYIVACDRGTNAPQTCRVLSIGVDPAGWCAPPPSGGSGGSGGKGKCSGICQ